MTLQADIKRTASASFQNLATAIHKDMKASDARLMCCFVMSLALGTPAAKYANGLLLKSWTDDGDGRPDDETGIAWYFASGLLFVSPRCRHGHWVVPCPNDGAPPPASDCACELPQLLGKNKHGKNTGLGQFADVKSPRRVA